MLLILRSRVANRPCSGTLRGAGAEDRWFETLDHHREHGPLEVHGLALSPLGAEALLAHRVVRRGPALADLLRRDFEAILQERLGPLEPTYLRSPELRRLRSLTAILETHDYLESVNRLRVALGW